MRGVRTKEANDKKSREEKAYTEDTLGTDLDHGLLEGLGRDDGFLGNGSVAGSKEELLVARSRVEECLSVHDRGILGPLSAEHVGGESGDVRRGHPVERHLRISF